MVLFIVAFAGYAAIDRLTFKMPQNVEAGAVCDFTQSDFTKAGHLKYSINEAWWTSFVRKQEYFSSFSAALAITFVGFALTKIRQIGAAAATGSVVGGGLLLGLTLAFSCLAPVLAAVGIGFFANLGFALAEIPKWAVTLSNFVLTVYGFMYLSRRASSCPLAACPTSTVPTFGGEA